ncbi:hypothetical protein K439DRAFT_426048 [Ramaria rubella]|nr:hypothetical protein K439DRAFT_426048 [Ramaria rubella]
MHSLLHGFQSRSRSRLPSAKPTLKSIILHPFSTVGSRRSSRNSSQRSIHTAPRTPTTPQEPQPQPSPSLAQPSPPSTVQPLPPSPAQSEPRPEPEPELEPTPPTPEQSTTRSRKTSLLSRLTPSRKSSKQQFFTPSRRPSRHFAPHEFTALPEIVHEEIPPEIIEKMPYNPNSNDMPIDAGMMDDNYEGFNWFAVIII